MRSNRMKKFKKQKKVIRSILLIIIGLVAVFFSVEAALSGCRR